MNKIFSIFDRIQGLILLLPILILSGPFLAAVIAPAIAGQTVYVGGYAFPPYVSISESGDATGLTPDLIQKLNKLQDRYEFRFAITSPLRRYEDFSDGKFSMLLFEMPEWGWKSRNIPVSVSDTIATDGEVYIARAMTGRYQSYFDRVKYRKIVGILGYNYGFSGFRNDPDYLRSRFDISLVTDHETTIKMVMGGRVDVGVVTLSYLRRYLRKHPKLADKLLVSEGFDQKYRLGILAKPGTTPDVQEVAAMIRQLEKNGEMDALWRKYGLNPQHPE